jgi:hypothetical protein
MCVLRCLTDIIARNKSVVVFDKFNCFAYVISMHT